MEPNSSHANKHLTGLPSKRRTILAEKGKDTCGKYLDGKVWDCCLGKYKRISDGVDISNGCVYYSGKHEPRVDDRAE